MNPQQKSLRVGLAAVALAVLIRFFSAVHLEPLIRTWVIPQAQKIVTYVKNRNRFSPEEPEITPTIVASFPEPELIYTPESPPPVPPPLPYFEDPALVELTYLCGYRPDIGSLLRSPLSWDLASGEPTVLIFHTHTTESYEKGDADYTESAPYRTTDERYNILSIGDRVTELLNAQGIVTLHDREFHDYPNYNGCYGRTRACTLEYLKEYPSLRLILDLHRDACEGTSGQLRTLAKAEGKDSAQLMLVVGSNAGGIPHRHWAENLSLALKLHAQLQTQNPGIVRPLSLRAQRFNQDLSPGALLIEVGGAGNSHEEAMLAGEQLAKAITALSRGTGEGPDLPESPSAPKG